jgi:hypothetical protein
VDPSSRALRSRLGGLTTAARGHVNTEAARAAFASKFYEGLDDLPDVERERRAAAARKLHFAKLAYASAQARRRR